MGSFEYGVWIWVRDVFSMNLDSDMFYDMISLVLGNRLFAINQANLIL